MFITVNRKQLTALVSLLKERLELMCEYNKTKAIALSGEVKVTSTVITERGWFINKKTKSTVLISDRITDLFNNILDDTISVRTKEQNADVLYHDIKYFSNDDSTKYNKFIGRYKSSAELFEYQLNLQRYLTETFSELDTFQLDISDWKTHLLFLRQGGWHIDDKIDSSKFVIPV